MSQIRIKENIIWYEERRPHYEKFEHKINKLITEILDSEKIPYHTIESRTKSLDSFNSKIKQKMISKPTEIEDIVGVRIIGYVESDILKIISVIKENFDLDYNKMENKQKELGVSKVGYRSTHFLCNLSNNRSRLSEYQQFSDIPFELQIRTILQHAWAEIEHDRNYKFSGILPEEIQRNFNLLSGLLELADNEFERISNLIEKYSQQVSQNTKEGKLDITINSTSLKQFLIERFGDNNHIKPTFESVSSDDSRIIVDELHDMGIHTLLDLENIIPKDLEEIYEKLNSKTTFARLIRQILIIHDMEKYFTDAWKSHFLSFTSDSEYTLGEYGINLKKIQDYFRHAISNPNMGE
ncbi:MAG: hypothetical protein OEM28_10330 [Nitrosopumilus sp.]|nr:hypothetical protein [Nitrosopumilus sp.]